MTAPYWKSDCGKYTLYHGDCMEIMPEFEDGCVDALVTDPPYSVSVAGSAHIGPRGRRNLDFFAGDSDWEAMTRLVVQAAEISIRLVNDDASMYWWCGHRQFGSLVEMFERSGWNTRFLVWSKTCPAPSPPGSCWPSGAELCVFAFRPGRWWSYADGKCPKSNVIVSDSYRFGQPGKVNHPTQKPFVTMQLPIESSCRPRGIVLDPFTGSGTTGVACVKTDRRFIGIEINERFCEIAAKRIATEANHLFKDVGGLE